MTAVHAETHVYAVLWTAQVKQKAKLWNDGTLKLHVFNKRAMLHDSANVLVDSTFLTRSSLEIGDTLRMEHHLVTIEDAMTSYTTDISSVIRTPGRKSNTNSPTINQNVQIPTSTVVRSRPVGLSRPLSTISPNETPRNTSLITSNLPVGNAAISAKRPLTPVPLFHCNTPMTKTSSSPSYLNTPVSVPKIGLSRTRRPSIQTPARKVSTSQTYTTPKSALRPTLSKPVDPTLQLQKPNDGLTIPSVAHQNRSIAPSRILQKISNNHTQSSEKDARSKFRSNVHQIEIDIEAINKALGTPDVSPSKESSYSTSFDDDAKFLTVEKTNLRPHPLSPTQQCTELLDSDNEHDTSDMITSAIGSSLLFERLQSPPTSSRDRIKDHRKRFVEQYGDLGEITLTQSQPKKRPLLCMADKLKL
ncbi:hypothetical protein V1512DRAFT_255900 [Lipomyces arxii]|uniref:uncharacterized protein n=1 Tax=Lipomyces arxii TaxID=56418 RepID=UPI0034CD9488